MITIFIIIIIIILIILFFINNTKKSEGFSGYSKSLSSKNKKILNKKNLNKKNNIQSIKNDVLFSNKDYNENLSIDNKDLNYFYDNIIDQSDINENSFDIINSIDLIDYADVKTGIQKCNKKCSGICFYSGYNGVATCYPKIGQSFDFGTLYKNPTFTYGYNAYGPNNLKK